MNYKIRKPNLDYFAKPLNNKAKTINPGLLAFLNSNKSGIDIDIRTPLFNKVNRKSVIDEWKHVLNKYKTNILLELYDLEIDQSTKIGRYSAMFPFKERFNDVKSYYTNELDENHLDHYDRQLITDGIHEYYTIHNKSHNSIRPISFNNAIREIPLNTNSGLPEFQKRSTVINDVLKRLSIYYNSSDRYFQEYLKAMSCILGWRGQQVDKQRVVWMFPMDANVLESMYYKPLIVNIQKHKTKPEFISQYCIEDRITDLFATKSDNDLVIATDFDKFDQHFNRILQDISYNVKCFKTHNQYIDHKFKLIHYLKYNIPLICTKDIMFYGHHGMASGSSGTNMDENESHEVMQNCAALANGSKLNANSSCLGDDGFISYHGISVENVTEVYRNVFGQEMNKSKQYASYNSVVYLQRLYSTAYRSMNGRILGVYPTMRALGRLLGQERFINPEFWSNEIVVLRSLSILENCNRHPLFEQFVDFVIKGDKYQLGINIPGFFEKYGSMSQSELYSKVDPIIGFQNRLEFESNPERGISDWRVFKYLVKRSKINRGAVA